MDLLDPGKDFAERYTNKEPVATNLTFPADLLDEFPSSSCSFDTDTASEEYNIEIENEEFRSDDRGLTVAFKDLTYNVRNHADKKQKIALLKGVTGLLHTGLMSALMGPSGSGKTTLLDCLAGRKTTGDVTGSILFAGRSPSRSFLRRFTGYVEQFDTLIGNFTVYEQLLYTSELKNPQEEALGRKKERVEVVLDQLSLKQCKDVTIGSALKRGISGGQCKRVNIGIALVTNPRVLFLDEPTSGLDSFTANEVMLVVKGLVKSGMTVCATIHSPTPFSFNLFDYMMILLGGRVIYCGRNGKAALSYFEETNPHLPHFGSAGCEKDNPAEWIVDITTQADRDGRQDELASMYAQHNLSHATNSFVAAEVSCPEELSQAVLKELRTKKATSTSFFFALSTILKYRLWKDFRDLSYLAPRIVDKLLIALISATLYWKLAKPLRHGVPASDFIDNTLLFKRGQSITALLFMQTILPAFAASTYTPSLVLERTVFYRERADGLFTPLCYLVSKLVGELILAAVNSVAFGALVFYVVALGGSFLLYFLTVFCTYAIGIALGYLVAAISPNMEVANALLPAYVISMLYFVGLLIRVDDMPDYWHWFIWLNPLQYSWTAMMINQFSYSNVLVPYNGRILPYFGISPSYSKWAFLGYEACFLVVFWLMAWLALQFVKHQKR